MKVNKILIVGIGSIGLKHFNIAKNLLPKAKIAILSKRKDLQFLNIREDLKYSKIEDAILFKPDIVIICNSAAHHIQYTKPFIDIGSSILIEKPISNNAIEAELFEKYLKNKSNKITIGYNMRYINSLLKFKEYIQSGKIGEIFSIRCDVGQNLLTWRKNSDYKKDVSANKKLGGGVLLELSHEIDYLLWIFKDIEWVSAVVLKRSNLEIDVEDTAHINLGIKSNITNNKITVANINMDFIRRDITRSCIVIGEKSTLKWNGIDGSLDILKSDEGIWKNLSKDEFNSESSYYAEWKNLINSIQGLPNLLISPHEAVRVLKIIELIKLSNKKERKIYNPNFKI